MNVLNQLVSISLQLQQDIKLTNHKYMAHQLALLYVILIYYLFDIIVILIIDSILLFISNVSIKLVDILLNINPVLSYISMPSRK